MKGLWAWPALPARDVLGGLERCLEGGSYGALARVGLGLLLGWWIYVPVHELLHALGCWATGGTVERLEIAALYGGGVLERLLPFVVAGGEYAGRLSGFDTLGSDAVYLATDLAPFVLTVFPGVWWLRRARRAVLWGASLPFALAPFLSLPGDAYEIGSILTTRLAPWSPHADVLRGDDVVRVAGGLGGLGAIGWSGLLLGASVGVLWAFLVYGLGAFVAGRLGAGPDQLQGKASVSVTGSAARPSGSR